MVSVLIQKDVKKFNPALLNVMLRVAILKVRRTLREEFDNFPESSIGVDVDYNDVEEKIDLLEDQILVHGKDLLGLNSLPQITDEELDEKFPGETGLPAPEPASLDPYDPTNYKFHDRINMKTYEGKGFQWMDHTGSYYGGETLFVYSDGSKLLVPDAKKTHAEDGNLNNKNQKYYFCGTDPAHQHGMSGRASIFTEAGSDMRLVVVFYNK